MKSWLHQFMNIFAIALLLITASPALVWADCPKGKTVCDHPCGQYVDANGNSICDLIESSSMQTDPGSSIPDNITPDAPPAVPDPMNQGSVAENSNDSPDQTDSSEAANDVSTTENEQIEPSEPQISNSETATNNASTVNSEPFFAALWDPKFMVTLLLLALALIIVEFKLSTPVRLGILGLSLLALGFYFKGCLCPVGALANLPLHLAGISTGQSLLWLLLFLAPIVFLFWGGRIFCGGVCPFGAVQEFTFRLGNKLGLNQGRPGLEKAPWLKYLKYLVLLAVLVITPLTGSAWWCNIDPFGYLFNFSGTKIALGLLIGLLIVSLFISRFWCRFLCPYGALLGILNKDLGLLLGKTGVALSGPCIDQTTCKSCSKCAKKCPVNAIKENVIDMAECINCGECSQQCKIGAVI